jgi:hypothetical protein
MRNALRACRAWSAGALLLAGCASASFANGIYDDGTVRYRIGELKGAWRRLDVDDNDLAFYDTRLGTISVNSMCSGYEDVPEQALLNQLLFGTRDRKYRLEETVTLDGRGALHDVIDLTLDGVPVTLEVYVVKKDGCVYDFSRVSSRPAFEQGRPAFAALVQGFKVLHTAID